MLKVNSDTLIEALSVVDRSVGAETVSVSASGQTLTVAASLNGKAMVREIAANVDKDIHFSTHAGTLIGLCRRRGTVTLKSSNSEVTVKSGKYSATIAVVPHESVSIEEPEGNEIDLDSSEMEVIAKLCQTIQLNNVFEDGCPQLPVHIRTDQKGTRVVCVDNTHTASLVTKQVQTNKQTDIVLPSGVLSAVNNSASGIPYRIILTDASIYAHGESDDCSFSFITPLAQEGNGIGISEVLELERTVKKIPDSEITSISLSVEELNNTMGNILSVTESNSMLTFETDKKGKELIIRISSEIGSVQNRVASTISGKDVSADFGIALLSDVLAKIKGDDVTLNIAESFMFVTQTNGQNRILYLVSRS